MLKINFSLLDTPIEVTNGTLLVLEDCRAFTDFIKNLYQFNEESDLKIFNNEYKSIKYSELLIVTDVLGYDVNSPSVLKNIYEDLENQLNETPEIKSQINQLMFKISDIMNHELIEHEMDLESDEITFLELFKVLGIKIETKSDTFLEKMIEIIQIFKYLSKKKLLVFINTSSYLLEEELKEILEFISLMQIDALFVEPKKKSGIYQTVVDSDFYIQYE